VTIELSFPDAQTSGGSGSGDVLIAVENLVGSAFDDTLGGDVRANLLQGGAGDDTIEGRGGADSLVGGDGVDTASYVNSAFGVTVSLSVTGPQTSAGDASGDVLSQFENLRGTNVGDALTGDAGANRLYGEGGSDSLHGAAGDDSLEGGSGDDSLDGGAGADTLVGGSGADWASYASSTAAVTVDIGSTVAQTGGGDVAGDVFVGVENLIGSAFADWLVSGGAANALDGGAGEDTVSYENSTAGVIADLGVSVSQISGGDASGDVFVNIEHLAGSASADWLGGDASANRLSGGTGDDTLDGGLGQDTLEGGDGRDAASYARAGAGVSVDLGLTTAQAGGGHAGGDVFVDIEDFVGSSWADTIESAAAANRIDGGLGFDVASYGNSTAGVTVDLFSGDPQGGAGSAAGDLLVRIEGVVGSTFADTLLGDQNANRLEGGLGDDTIEGRAGADTLAGGGGTDTVSYLSSAVGVTVDLSRTGTQSSGGDAFGDVLSGFENLIGSNLVDVLTGDGADNRIDAGLGNDTVSGGAGNDTLQGEDGDDLMQGEAGDDSLVGGAGDDTLVGGNGADTLVGGINQFGDFVSYAGTVAVTVDLGVTTAQSGAGPVNGDVLIGIEGVIGSSLGDELRGDAGNNRLIGGDGDDTLHGGAGADTIDGGAGLDAVSFAYATLGVGVRLDGGVSWAGDAVGDVYIDVENLTGSSLGDEVLGSAAANRIDGGGGWDRVSYANSTAGVTVLFGLTTAQTSGGYASGDVLLNLEALTGSNHADLLVGSDGQDIIDGGAGDDTIEGGAGYDNMGGGAGIDTLSYASSTSAVMLAIYGGSGLAGGAYGDSFGGFERYVLTDHDDYAELGGAVETVDGGAGTDTVSYTWSTLGVTVDLGRVTAQSGGYAAGDVLLSIENVTGSATAGNLLTGEGGANHLVGGESADTISGGGGDDTIAGNAGADVLAGGSGADTLDLDDGSIYAPQAGTWTTVYVDGTAMLGTSFSAGDVATGFERVLGSEAREWLVVSSGVTHFDGGSNAGGYDTVDFSGSSAGVTVDLSLGGPQTSAGLASGMTIQNVEAVVGTAMADTLTGNASANWIWGQGGADTLSGGAGNDSLFMQAGQLGTAVTEGGAGYDALRVTGLAGGATVDFTTVAATASTIEEVDLRDGANQTATISAADVQAIVGSGASSMLTVRADFGDVVTIEDPYVTASAGGYTIYSDAAKTLQIAQVSIINADRTY
jgi:Ca2+-binding RTX toxin-like protein